MELDFGTSVREGDIIAGKYRVERILGRGGMGVVVAAVHVALKQQVAVKFLLPAALGGADTVARFVREAQAAARIQSEHVARVLDVATLENGLPYMVMEFLEGRDLSQLLAVRGGSLPFEEAVGYVLQACQGVAEAHAAGIIHRDIKPSNLFVCERGAGRNLVKVLDFGIAKSLDAALGPGEASLTKSSTVMGSPLYMSPEQMKSAKHVDVRTDIWSLGVALFEMISGKTPFTGESMTELVAAVLDREPASLRDLCPDLPPDLVTAVARSLEKDRERRYPNVAELAAALAPFGPRHSAVIVERISEVLGGARTEAAPRGASDPPAKAAVDSGGLPYDRTAAAASGGRSTTGAGRTTAQPVSNDSDRSSALAPRRRGPAVGLIVAGAVVALAAAGAVVMKRGPSKAEVTRVAEPVSALPRAPSPTAPTAILSAGATPAAAAPSASSAPATSSSSAPTLPAAASHRAAPAHPVAPPTSTTLARPAAVSPSATAPASTPSCRVVQYFDADGETRFKKDCP